MSAAAQRARGSSFRTMKAKGEWKREVYMTLKMTVSVQRGMRPIVVQGYGINEGRFKDFAEVYNTFCGFLAPIKLDYLGCEAIEGCLYDLGYTPEKPY